MTPNETNIAIAMEPVNILRWLRVQTPTLDYPTDSVRNMLTRYLEEIFQGYSFDVSAGSTYCKQLDILCWHSKPLRYAMESLYAAVFATKRPVGTGLYITQLAQAIDGSPEKRPTAIRQVGFDEFRYYYTASAMPRPAQRTGNVEYATEWLIGWEQAVDGLARREAAYGDIYRSMTPDQLAQIAAEEIASRA